METDGLGVADVLARERVRNRAAVERHPHRLWTLARAHDQEHAASLEAEREARIAPGGRGVAADPPAAGICQVIGRQPGRGDRRRTAALPGRMRPVREALGPAGAQVGLGGGDGGIRCLGAGLRTTAQAPHSQPRPAGCGSPARSPRRRPRRSARTAPARGRRSGTWPASTGCRTRSKWQLVVLGDRVGQAPSRRSPAPRSRPPSRTGTQAYAPPRSVNPSPRYSRCQASM